MIQIDAVYENGVLRPLQPLALKEGETVQLTVSPPSPRPADEIAARMRAATSLDELFAIANASTAAPPGYDLCDALDENRRRDGVLPLFPPDKKGETW